MKMVLPLATGLCGYIAGFQRVTSASYSFTTLIFSIMGIWPELVSFGMMWPGFMNVKKFGCFVKPEFYVVK